MKLPFGARDLTRAEEARAYAKKRLRKMDLRDDDPDLPYLDLNVWQVAAEYQDEHLGTSRGEIERAISAVVQEEQGIRIDWSCPVDFWRVYDECARTRASIDAYIRDVTAHLHGNDWAAESAERAIEELSALRENCEEAMITAVWNARAFRCGDDARSDIVQEVREARLTARKCIRDVHEVLAGAEL